MNFYKIVITIFVLTVVFFIFHSYGGNGETEIKNIYASEDEYKYLTGRFDPVKNNFFLNLKKTGIVTDGRVHFLRKETVAAFIKLLNAFREDYPDIEIKVISATRTFYSQKNIWESKFKGKRLVDGKNLFKAVPDKLKRSIVILKYSSMPGTSRHHWGTDFDINSLENSYFEKGNGKIIYNWLRKNAGKYGFGQPYSAGRKAGYQEEKWHWSYLPLSKPLLKKWNNFYEKNKDKFIAEGLFAGSKEAGSLAPIYVSEISDECK